VREPQAYRLHEITRACIRSFFTPNTKDKHKERFVKITGVVSRYGPARMQER
jgi:hypothetical protein